MFAHQRKKIQLLCAVADALLTILAFEAAYATRTRLPLEHRFFLVPNTHALILCFCASVWVAIGLVQQVYEHLGSGSPVRLIWQTARQALLGIFLTVLFQYLLGMEYPVSRGFILLFFVLNLLLLVAFRLLLPRFVGAFQRGFGTPYHLVLIGDSAKTAPLARQLSHGSPFRIEITAQIREEECRSALPRLLAEQIVDEVIFSVDSSHLSKLEDVFFLCDEEGVSTRVAIDFFPQANSDVTLDRVGDATLLTFSAAPLDDLRLVLKRFFDVCASAMALVVLAPFLGVVALLIKLSSPGAVIFTQSRCGLNGRRFTLYKLRSMVDNAHDLRPDLEHLNERGVVFKLPNDPRITPIGRWIRKFSVDELPQLYNVLRGDMSIVGPRPPLPSEVDRYERWQRRRLRMRPGLTCLWAISGRDHIDFNTWMRLDISYIENWSLQLDWSIILKTIPHVLAGKGAH
ncbi:MAG TPA: sugar transferase [Bryobacteraceae bacterium]|nr:sugar transferase [Bryobacteraceae bacterium]